MKIEGLSIVIITNRIDEKFEAALQSAQFAKEIIVVDNTNQTDWEKLKKEYSTKILQYPEKITDFSKIRNFSLEFVQTPWVLFLDSDETLPVNSQDEIQKIIDQNIYDAVNIKRTDYFLDKPLQFGEAGNIWLTRLFKTNIGKFSRAVHEILEFEGKLGTANFVISHFSHNSIKEFLEKITSYAYMESKSRTYSNSENTFQMCLYPIGKFILNYFFRLGFLDGYRGLTYAVMMSLHSFFVRVFYYEKL